MSPPAETVRMEVKGLMLDPSSNMPIVILRDLDKKVFLPIWIGVFEANAIAMRMEGVQAPRPMTHDLLQSALEQLGAEVERILISDLKDNTFYARIHLLRNGHELAIDSRPSDALALALRVDAPIFVQQEVLEKAEAVDLVSRATSEERLREWLENVKPEDLGKYTM